MSILGNLIASAGTRRRTRVYDATTQISFTNYLLEYMSPVGTIITKLSSNTPGDAWVIIAGQPLPKTTYAELYADIGGMFGEDALTFNLPDLSNTYFAGVGTLLAGAIGGTNDVLLSVNNLPVHGHSVTDPQHTHIFAAGTHTHMVTDIGHTHTVNDLGHVHPVSGAGGATAVATSGAGVTVGTSGNTGSAMTGLTNNPSASGVTINSASGSGVNASTGTGISIGTTGGGATVDNRPSTIAVYHFIKTRN